MKFKVTFKDPDVVYDAITDAAKESIPDCITDEEREALAELRRDELSEFTSKWVRYGEYITLEFDSEAKTATVVPSK